ncbi:hypothetical protein F4778DRAFT_791012 [Xylariomycetidae sp. FL2044]|nr:hypothetical protein F4778DRAFT_791012 [Xylariomycetidae sp. FL2044]
MDPARQTNWPAIRDFVPTAHSDTYPFISAADADLTGKSVLITGASRGIGKAIALSFAAAGCSRLAVVARTGVAATTELEQAIVDAARAAGRDEPRVLAISADITSEADVDRAASTVAEAFGGALDVLVNNAGRAEAMLPVAASRVDDFWSAWEVNLKGPYLCTRALLPLLTTSDTRTIINVSSAGAHMLTRGLLGYQTAKFALCRFTEFLVKEYEGQGLVAVALHPGDVLTNMTQVMPAEWRGVFVDKPELAADTMVWLARERREWLSGRFLSATWDMRELEERKADIVRDDLLKFRLTLG